VSIGKLSLKEPFETLIPDQLSRNSIELMPILVNHTTTVVTLPFHHNDPFDRLLIAQAMTEQIPIVSVDAVFDAYPVTRLW
jgi:PIN domain nuclease of toxin-antitoxin system